MATITSPRAVPAAGARRAERRAAITGAAAVSAGVLWAVYGWFELSTPFGPDTVYDRRRGFEVVVDGGRFALHSLPGAGALLASALTLLRLPTGPSGRRARWSRRLARAAALLGVSALAGVAGGSVPLFLAPLALGTPIVGAAAWLAAGRWQAPRRRVHLRSLGVAAIALAGVWPAVWAIEVLSATAGAVLIAVFGLAWAALAAGDVRLALRGAKQP